MRPRNKYTNNNNNNDTTNGKIVDDGIEKGGEIQIRILFTNSDDDDDDDDATDTTMIWSYIGSGSGRRMGLRSSISSSSIIISSFSRRMEQQQQQREDVIWIDGMIYKEPWQDHSYEDWEGIVREVQNFFIGVLFLLIIRRILIHLLRTRYRSNSIE